FFFKQKTAYEIFTWLEFRRVLFRSPAQERGPGHVPGQAARPQQRGALRTGAGRGGGGAAGGGQPAAARACQRRVRAALPAQVRTDRKSTRLNSSHVKISYAVFCLKK